MANSIVDIIYRLVDKVTPEAKKVSGSLKNIESSAESAGDGVDSLDKKQGKLSASMAEFVGISAGIVYGLQKIGKNLVGAAIDYEQQEMAFTSMLGSSLRAQELIADIQKTAASTPFEQSDLIDYAKKLIAVGTASSDVIPAMTMLGDVASALGTERLPQIVRGYSDIQAAGRAMGGDLKQLRDAAVPIEQYLAKVLGVTTSQVRKLSEESQISSEDVKKAFQLMTSEGERFHGMMAAQAKTTGGAISNLRDQIGVMAIALGTPLLGPVNSLVNGLRFLIEQFNKLSPGAKTFIAISGAVATGVMAMSTAFGLLALSLGGAKIALMALAGSTGIGLVVGGIVLLGTAVYKNMDSVKIAVNETRLVFQRFALGVVESVNKIMAAIAKIPGGQKIVNLSAGGSVADDIKKEIAATEATISAIKESRKKAADDEVAAKKQAIAEAAALEKKELDEKAARLKQENDAKIAAQNESAEAAAKKAQEKADKEKEILLKEKDEELEIRRKAIAAELLMTSKTGEQDAAFAQSQADKYRDINSRLIEDTRAAAEEDFLREQELANLSLEQKILRVEQELAIDEMSAERRNALSQKLYDLEIQRMAALDAKKKQQQAMFLDAFAKMGDGQLSLQEAVSQGMLEFYKREAYAAVDIEAGKMFQTGMARLIASLFTDPIGYAHLAGSAALVAGSRAAIGSIKLAEGGVVMPQPGGVRATVAEAGKPEIVMPLDDPRAASMMGGAGGREVIILSSDGQTMLAKGIYAEQQELLRTGQIGRSRI
jgi:tape measure domain-containing protein